MSDALPPPTSGNRSLISATTNLQPAPYAYVDRRDAQLAAEGSYATLPADISHVVSPTDMSHIAHGPVRNSLSGTVIGGAPDQERTTHVSQEYNHHNSMPFRDQYHQLHPVAMYSSSEDSALSTYPSRPYDAAAVSDVRSARSRSSISHSPPTHQSSLPSGSEPQASAPKPPPKRREKPRIELSADQPLTTQGKQRARVYVACVQWRVVHD